MQNVVRDAAKLSRISVLIAIFIANFLTHNGWVCGAVLSSGTALYYSSISYTPALCSLGYDELQHLMHQYLVEPGGGGTLQLVGPKIARGSDTTL